MSEDLVTVHITNADWEAHLIKNELEEADVPAHLAMESVRHVYGLFADGLGQIRIQVLQRDEEQARQIIADYQTRQQSS